MGLESESSGVGVGEEGYPLCDTIQICVSSHVIVWPFNPHVQLKETTK